MYAVRFFVTYVKQPSSHSAKCPLGARYKRDKIMEICCGAQYSPPFAFFVIFVILHVLSSKTAQEELRH
jgi:hypothetical protein